MEGRGSGNAISVGYPRGPALIARDRRGIILGREVPRMTTDPNQIARVAVWRRRSAPRPDFDRMAKGFASVIDWLD
jgi:hypothetical protein